MVTGEKSLAMSRLVTCPVCEQYEDRPESVRAHISAKRDDLHSGESGFDYDSQLGLDDDETGDETGDGSDTGLDEPQLDLDEDLSGNGPTPVPTKDDPDTGSEDDSGPTEVPTVQSVERDRDEDGNELVKLTLYGAGAYGVAKLLSGLGDQNRDPYNRDRL